MHACNLITYKVFACMLLVDNIDWCQPQRVGKDQNYIRAPTDIRQLIICDQTIAKATKWIMKISLSRKGGLHGPVGECIHHIYHNMSTIMLLHDKCHAH